MRILLDTCSLNPIGVKNNKEELTNLNTFLKSKSAQLCILHVNFDERYKGKKSIYKKLRDMTDHYARNGLEIHQNMSEIFIPGITKKGTAKTATAFQLILYEELRELIEKCERFEKPSDNLDRDAIIGVSSLNYDIFITSNRCLEKSLNSVIEKNESKIEHIPEIAYREPKYEEILDEIKLQLGKEH